LKRDAQLRGDLALAGAVEVVAAGGQHRVDQVQAGDGGVALDDHEGSLEGDHSSVKRSHEQSGMGDAARVAIGGR
jgi:hypothetical protein